MTKEELKERIGKDFILQFNNQSKNLRIPWKDWLTIDWDIIEVGEEFRTNKLSKEDGRYIMFLGAENQFRKYKCYTNIHNYIAYIRAMFKNSISTLGVFDNDFIYVWDDKKKELIVALEMHSDNRCSMLNELIDALNLGKARIVNS